MGLIIVLFSELKQVCGQEIFFLYCCPMESFTRNELTSNKNLSTCIWIFYHIPKTDSVIKPFIYWSSRALSVDQYVVSVSETNHKG